MTRVMARRQSPGHVCILRNCYSKHRDEFSQGVENHLDFVIINEHWTKLHRRHNQVFVSEPIWKCEISLAEFMTHIRNFMSGVFILRKISLSLFSCHGNYVTQRTWQDAWSVSAHVWCRQLSSQILAKLFSFINIFGVDSRLWDDPQLFYVLRDL